MTKMSSRRPTRRHHCQTTMLCVRLSCLVLACISQKAERSCQQHGREVSGYSKDGDVLIGGIFAVHLPDLTPISYQTKPEWITCKIFSSQSYQWLQAMVFAIEEINRSTTLLPNISLGFRIHDSCMMMNPALEGVLWMLSENKEPIPNYRRQATITLAGIVGDTVSTHSVVIAWVLGLYRYPQISYFATSPLLSDRNQFPSFFRTIPSDDFQSRGLAQLVIHFGWIWVGILAADNNYGQQGAFILQKELVKAGACIAFSENIVNTMAEENARYLTKVIKGSSANAIIIFSSDNILVPVMDELVKQNVTGKIWIASESWSTSALLTAQKYFGILAGTIGLAIHSGEIVRFIDYFRGLSPNSSPEDVFMKEFWEIIHDCKWQVVGLQISSNNFSAKLCSGYETLDISESIYSDIIIPRVTYNVYSAVFALALSLQDLLKCTPRKGPFQHGSCADILEFQPWQLLHYVRQVRSPGSEATDLLFDNEGNPQTQYDIVNWQRGTDGALKHVKVGIYDSRTLAREKFLINTSSILWNSREGQVPLSVCSLNCGPGFRKVASKGEPACCFLCIPCPPGEVSNTSDSTECSKCPWDQWPNEKQDQCRPKIIEVLYYEDPLGTTLAATTIFFLFLLLAVLGLFIQHRNTPIVKANNRSLSYLLLLSLSLCFLSSLTFIGYPTTEKCLVRQAAFGITFALCVSCILAKTLTVVMAFNATKPNNRLRRWFGPKVSYTVISLCTFIQVLLCVIWLILAPPFPEYNISGNPGITIVQCNEGSTTAFWCMLGYLGLLASVSFVVAFLARNLPSSFNDAKFITFSMLAFLSVWLSFVPAYLSTQGKYMVAMEIFAILSSTSALLFCIFFTKCYIILLKPEMNTKEHLMGKGKNDKHIMVK